MDAKRVVVEWLDSQRVIRGWCSLDPDERLLEDMRRTLVDEMKVTTVGLLLLEHPAFIVVALSHGYEQVCDAIAIPRCSLIGQPRELVEAAA